MPSPVSPTDLENQLPSLDKPLCRRFMDAISGFIFFWSRWFSYAFTESGGFTDAFKEDICATGAVNCPTTTPCLLPPDAPTNDITLTWGDGVVTVEIGASPTLDEMNASTMTAHIEIFDAGGNRVFTDVILPGDSRTYSAVCPEAISRGIFVQLFSTNACVNAATHPDGIPGATAQSSDDCAYY